MAVTNQGTAAFIAKLLAPIPADEEQADTKKYRSQIERDMRLPWHKKMIELNILRARQLVSFEDFRKSGERYVTDSTPAAKAHMAICERVRETIRELCLVPAATAKELRWKKRETRYSTLSDDVIAAIAADEARLTASEGR